MTIKTQILIIIILFISQFSFAQNNVLRVTSQRNNDKSITFSFNKEKYGSFFLSVWFTELNNSHSRGYNNVVKGLNGRLFTIKPDDENQGIGSTYRAWYIRGVPNPKLDTNYTYLLPLGIAQSAVIRTMTNVNSMYFGSAKPKGWSAYLFYMNVGDTVFASRKGVVVEVTNNYTYDTLNIVSYKSKVNSVLIEQTDGTLASYKGFTQNGIWVEEGQTVFPRTPLGIVSAYDKREQGQLRFSIYYLDYTNLKTENKNTFKNKISYYSYIEPYFLTKDGSIKLESGQSYKTVINNEIIFREFTKRELKKLRKKIK